MRPLRRRAFIAGGSGALLMAALGPVPATAVTPGRTASLACARTQDGRHQVVGLTHDGTIRFTLDLPGRGHGAAVSPEGTLAVAFARRPGRFALVLDLERERTESEIETPKDRHFAGHGFFSADGTLLYATEIDFDGERGVLGLYDAQHGFRRVGEFASHGSGPHEAILLRDGRTIAVANGGILTHPDFPRAKLNLAEMEPSLTFIDADNGRLLSRITPPRGWHQLSIRHIAEDAKGRVWFGCQYEGPRDATVPLVGHTRPGGTMRWLEAGKKVYRAMNQYIGSVACCMDAGLIAFSSPVGGRLAICDAASGSLVRVLDRPDICGLAADGAGLLASDGGGNLWREAAPLVHHPDIAWDNHIAAVSRRG